ncbi:MAG: hypothetical protein V1740_04160 [Candidatus Woesearchaeota archaeon]
MKQVWDRALDYTFSVGVYAEAYQKKDDAYENGIAVLNMISKELFELCEFGMKNHYLMCLPFAYPEPIFYEPTPNFKRKRKKQSNRGKNVSL